jgi:hypothetical protein
MNFTDFVRSLPKQDDKAINKFISFVKKDVNFPATSEPSKLAIYLYKQLDTEQTLAFQKLLLFYGSMPYNQLPKKCHHSQDIMLMAVNIIVSLQNFDEDYPFN